MRRIFIFAAVLAASCASGTSERIEKVENKMEGQILKSKRLEEDQQKMADRIAGELQQLRKDLRQLRDDMDLLRSQMAAVARKAASPADGMDIEAERVIQEELEYLRRTPKQAETIDSAIKRLRPLSAAAVPFLLVEVKQAMRRAELPVVSALEKVLLGLDQAVVVRALIPELENKPMRVLAAGLLGQIGHTSAREPLVKYLQIPAGVADDVAFRFAAAVSLVKLKGPEGKKAIPTIIEALSPIHRDRNILAYDILHRMTGFTFGYRMTSPDEEKIASQKKWQEWWEKHGDTFEFPEK